MGTSKGGTAALYFGLANAANYIIIGACQYCIGSYVSHYPDIFKGMTGNKINDHDINMLDGIMPSMLQDGCHSKSIIHLIHSKDEPTYERDIKYLIKDLNRFGFYWKEYECGFKEHGDVGRYFIPIAKKLLIEIKQNNL